MSVANAALTYALSYARLGLRVAPVAPGTKWPRIEQWQLNATTDLAMIVEWWTRWPDSGVSIVFDHPVFAVDIDPRHGGDDTLAELEREHGPLPDTVRSLTGGGGTHHLFTNTTDTPIVNNAGTSLGVGIDIRGVGGQIVAPPTLHPQTGIAYTFEIGCGPDEVAIAPAPQWMLDLLLATPVREARHERSPRVEGELPGDVFNAEHTWPELLEPDGWTLHSVHRSGYELWRGPHHDDQQGPSGSLYYGGTDLLHVFTGSIPYLVEHETYDKFGYVVRTRYSGDFAAAARELSAPSREAHNERIWQILTANAGTHLEIDPGAPESPIQGSVTHDGDTTLAGILVELAAGNHRFVVPWGEWYAWNGTVWVADAHEVLVQELAKSVHAHVRAIEAQSDEHLKVLNRLAARARSKAGIQAMIHLARSHPGVVLDYRALDTHHDLLTVRNGILNLNTAVLMPHDRRFLLSKWTDVAYDAEATCPRYDRFLTEVIPDAEVRVMMQRFAGYSLTGYTTEHTMLLLIGSGANGKSVYLSAQRRLMGDYARPMRSDVLMVQPNQSHPQEVAVLHGARLVTSSEIEAGSRLHEPRVKELTGGDEISTRRLYQNEWTFLPTHKLMLAANHLPSVRGGDEGIWRRLRVVRFEVTIPEAERDAGLTDELYGEMSGILNWALAGLVAWRAEGLTLPTAVDMATAEYRSSQDVIARFFEEAGFRLDPEATCRADVLNREFEKWCREQVPPIVPPMAKTRGAMLTEKGLRSATQRINDVTTRVWIGIAEPTLTPRIGGEDPPDSGPESHRGLF